MQVLLTGSRFEKLLSRKKAFECTHAVDTLDVDPERPGSGKVSVTIERPHSGNDSVTHDDAAK